MKKSVISIYGTLSQGKSETVRETANLLLATFANYILQAINIGADINYIVDPSSRIFQYLQRFVAQRCDITICSCRSRGATAWAVEHLHPPSLIRNHLDNQLPLMA